MILLIHVMHSTVRFLLRQYKLVLQYKFEDVGKTIIPRKSFLKKVSLETRYLLHSRFKLCISTKDDESTPGSFCRPFYPTFLRLSDDTKKLCATIELVGTLVTIAIK